MADKSTIPQIETRFVLNGLDDALHQMSAFTSKVKGEFGDIEKASSVEMKPLKGMDGAFTKLSSLGKRVQSDWTKFGSGAANALKPIEASVSKLGMSVGALGSKISSVGRSSFSALSSSAKLAFTAIGVGAAGAISAIGSVGGAAIKASEDAAERIRDIGAKSQQTGFTPLELQGLEVAGKQYNVELDDIIDGLATISQESQNVKDAFKQQDLALESARSKAQTDYDAAAAINDQAGMQAALDSYNSARLQSLNGVRDALRQIDAADTSKLNANELKKLQNMRKEYEAAEYSLIQSAGPQGRALIYLQEFGLDLNKALGGGKASFEEILWVIPKVTDQSKLLQIVMGAFGEDTGRKLLPLLKEGQAGLERSIGSVRKFGAEIDVADTKIVAAYTSARGTVGLAIEGIKNAVAREVLPQMTETASAFSDFLAKNKDEITAYIVSGFARLKVFSDDVMKLFNGDKSGFHLKFLDDIAPTLQYARREFGLFSDDVNAALNGQDTGFNYGFMNIVVPAIKDATEAMIEFNKELSLSWNGESKWGWLNTVMSSAQSTGRALDELYDRVTIGKDATEFPWINALVNMFTDLVAVVQKAFDLISGTVELISGPVGKFLEYASVGVQTTVVDPAKAGINYLYNSSPFAAEENALFEATRQGMVYDNERYFARRQLNGAQLNSGSGETVNVNIVAPDGSTANLKATKPNADAAVGMLQALSGRTAGGF